MMPSIINKFFGLVWGSLTKTNFLATRPCAKVGGLHRVSFIFVVRIVSNLSNKIAGNGESTSDLGGSMETPRILETLGKYIYIYIYILYIGVITFSLINYWSLSTCYHELTHRLKESMQLPFLYIYSPFC
jgi:hypothetical protein